MPRKILPKFWREGMFRIFLTHLAKERVFAGELQEALFKYGISCFVAHKDIEPSSHWQTEIIKALRTCGRPCGSDA
jgi:hypothetical protein